MNIKSRLKKIEEAVKPEFEVIIIKDDEEHLRASLQGPGKIVTTESEIQALHTKMERLRAEGKI